MCIFSSQIKLLNFKSKTSKPNKERNKQGKFIKMQYNRTILEENKLRFDFENARLREKKAAEAVMNMGQNLLCAKNFDCRNSIMQL